MTNDEQSFAVKIGGFRTKEQALEFLDWYGGGGEQWFGEHLGMIDKKTEDGCLIDVDIPYVVDSKNRIVYAQLEQRKHR